MFSFKNWIKFLIEPLFSLNGCGGGGTDDAGGADTASDVAH